jgi:hypothetical protein
MVMLAVRYGTPGIYTLRDYAEAGGLMSYGPDNADHICRQCIERCVQNDIGIKVPELSIVKQFVEGDPAQKAVAFIAAVMRSDPREFSHNALERLAKIDQLEAIGFREAKRDISLKGVRFTASNCRPNSELNAPIIDSFCVAWAALPVIPHSRHARIGFGATNCGQLVAIEGRIVPRSPATKCETCPKEIECGRHRQMCQRRHIKNSTRQRGTSSQRRRLLRVHPTQAYRFVRTEEYRRSTRLDRARAV